MSLEARHVSVLRRMFKVGEPVEFVEELADYDETTGLHSNDRVLTVKGHAVAIAGDPIELARANLLEQNPVTILFVPDTLGEAPAEESDIMFKGRVRKARKIMLLAVGAKVILT